MLKNLKANTLLYVLILVNIALIMGVVVFNNSITISNNLSIWTNSEEMYRNIYDKWNIAIQSVKKFNSNWQGFIDILSCPTNVTMSGSNYKVTWINTQMAYEHWTIYCKWTYRWDDFKIFFNIDRTYYDSVYYKGDLVKLNSTWIDETNNLWPQTNVTWTADKNWHSRERAADNSLSTDYVSEKWNFYSHLYFTFPTSQNIWKVVLKKDMHFDYWWGADYWDRMRIKFYDDSNNVFVNKTAPAIRWTGTVIINLWVAWLNHKTKKIKINSRQKNKYMDMKDVYMYGYNTNGWVLPSWVWEREFNDSDNTLISFDSQWTEWWDNIDDDMNSDDYKWSSTGSINYAFGYEDDDVIPRKTFWWNVPAWFKYYNIFWNNYKTDDFINNNPYNNLWYSKKIWDVWTWYMYIDTYNIDNYNSWSSIFDLKIVEFNKNAYKQKNTLLAVKSWEWTWISNFVWYIEKSSSWNLSLSYYKTWNEFPFDFKDKDYAIFVTNENKIWDISYILKAETDTWTWIYINPINDSLTWTINVLANHMLMWGDKNFIWENFNVVWPK